MGANRAAQRSALAAGRKIGLSISDRFPVRGWLFAIVTVSVLLRLVAGLALGDVANPISGAYDQVSYDALAQRLVAGYGFSFPTDSYPFVRANEPTSHWSFLYTLYLAAVYAIFGHHPLAARLIQVLVSGLQCWLVYRIGRRLYSEWVGVASAMLTAGYAYFIFFNAALMTQTFYIIALLAALDLTLTLAAQSRLTSENLEPATWNLQPETWNLKPATWLLLGLSLGVGTLMRQTLLLFMPILFAYIWWSRRRSSRSIPVGATIAQHPRGTDDFSPLPTIYYPLLTGTILSLVIIAALVLPWTIRNYVVYHDFLLLNSNSGFWFYSSNHPNQGTQFDATYVAPIPDNLKELSEPVIDRALLREGIGYIVADPIRFLQLSWSRVGVYFWVLPSDESSTISNLARLLSFTLYAPFMLAGLILSRHHWRECLPLYLYVAFDTTLCLISWSAPRYRLPSDSIMMVFAGLAIVALAQRLHILRLAPNVLNFKSPNPPRS